MEATSHGEGGSCMILLDGEDPDRPNFGRLEKVVRTAAKLTDVARRQSANSPNPHDACQAKVPNGRGSAGAAGNSAGAGAGGHLAADHHRVRLPDLQLGNGDLQVGQGRGCYCLRSLLLLRPPAPLLLPATLREDGAWLAAPRADQGGGVAAHHHAHRRLLLQGRRHHAAARAGARLGHGGRHRARWLLRLLPPPRHQSMIRRAIRRELAAKQSTTAIRPGGGKGCSCTCTHAGRQIAVKRGRRAARARSPPDRASYELLPISYRAGIGAGRPAVLVGLFSLTRQAQFYFPDHKSEILRKKK